MAISTCDLTDPFEREMRIMHMRREMERQAWLARQDYRGEGLAPASRNPPVKPVTEKQVNRKLLLLEV